MTADSANDRPADPQRASEAGPVGYRASTDDELGLLEIEEALINPTERRERAANETGPGGMMMPPMMMGGRGGTAAGGPGAAGAGGLAAAPGAGGLGGPMVGGVPGMPAGGVAPGAGLGSVAIPRPVGGGVGGVGGFGGVGMPGGGTIAADGSVPAHINPETGLPWNINPSTGLPWEPNDPNYPPYLSDPNHPGYLQPGDPGYPGYPGYPQPGDPGYGDHLPGDPGYPGYPGYPQPGDPGYGSYPQPGDPGYPGYPQPGDPGNSPPSYPQPGDPGYSAPAVPSYPGPGGDYNLPQPGDPGYSMPSYASPGIAASPRLPSSGPGGGYTGGGTAFEVDPETLQNTAKSWDELSGELSSIQQAIDALVVGLANFGVVTQPQPAYDRAKNTAGIQTAATATEFTSAADRLRGSAGDYRQTETDNAAIAGGPQ